MTSGGDTVQLWDLGAQLCNTNNDVNFDSDYKKVNTGRMVSAHGEGSAIVGVGTKSVSYTHLTLPTIYSV